MRNNERIILRRKRIELSRNLYQGFNSFMTISFHNRACSHKLGRSSTKNGRHAVVQEMNL